MNFVKGLGALMYGVIFSIMVYFMLTYILCEGEKWLDVPIGWYAFALIMAIVFLELVKSIVEDIFHLPFFWSCRSNPFGALMATAALLVGMGYMVRDVWEFHVQPKSTYEMTWVLLIFLVGVEMLVTFGSAIRMTWQTAIAR